MTEYSRLSAVEGISCDWDQWEMLSPPFTGAVVNITHWSRDLDQWVIFLVTGISGWYFPWLGEVGDISRDWVRWEVLPLFAGRGWPYGHRPKLLHIVISRQRASARAAQYTRWTIITAPLYLYYDVWYLEVIILCHECEKYVTYEENIIVVQGKTIISHYTLFCLWYI